MRQSGEGKAERDGVCRRTTFVFMGSYSSMQRTTPWQGMDWSNVTVDVVCCYGRCSAVAGVASRACLINT